MKKMFTRLIIFIVLSTIYIYANNTDVVKTKLTATNKSFNSQLEYKSKTVTSDVLLDESFEGTVTGWTAIDNDGNGETWGFYEEEPPADTLAHTGVRGAGCFYNSTGCDDWFITPQVALPASETATFSFWAKSHSSNFLESFNVKLSTGEAVVGAFSVTLQEVSQTPYEWTLYTYDLSAYSGQNVYLAVQCVSVDCFYLWVDDFYIETESGDDWTSQNITLYNTAEAELMARTGDIDNMGFGWPTNFDPFSGQSTPSHGFPWTIDSTDAPGTDRIMVVSSYVGTPPSGSDGYTNGTSRPDNDPQPITVTYDLNGITINSAILQVFADDFQAPVWGANYQVTIDNVRAPFFEDVINSLSQSGPIGKIVSVNIPNSFLQYFSDGEVAILFDDPTTGAGDGYAIDFVKILINPGTFTYTGTITGVVKNSEDNSFIAGATVSASGIIENVTNANGEFTLNDVPAGVNYISVEADGFSTTSTTVDLEADETENITIMMTPSIEIPAILSTDYGPPASANTWEKFTIPLTHESFGVESSVFEESMKNITMIRIRTELHTGSDIGSIDLVKMGDTYTSTFSSGTEGWTVMGDGTMSWVANGGMTGGYITIGDWATGDWHWAVAPDSWTGDISEFINENFEFYFKTDYPSYNAVVELHTGVANRIVMTADKMNLVPGETTQIEVKLNPQAQSNTTISLSSSNTSYITVPSSVIIPVGQISVTFTAEALSGISSQVSSVISASTSGYSTARLTMTVGPESTTTLTGIVTDATTGLPVDGAMVALGEISSTTDSDGRYLLENVPPGQLTAEFLGSPISGTAPLNVQFTDYSTANTQTVNSTSSGYIDYLNRQVQIIENQENVLDISLSPVLTSGAVRFVLSWDDDPRDLDSYLLTPEIEGTEYSIYYGNKGNIESVPYAILDVDDTDGYGPETITIHQSFDGTYKYYIKKFAGNQLLTESDAVIHIYNENGLINSLHIPTNGDGNYWYVCDMNGATNSINIVNTIQESAPASTSGKLLLANPKPSFKQKVQTDVISWEWDFGDGETSTEKNPQHLFTSSGYYTVQLKVSDGDNDNIEIKEDYIYVENSVTTIDTLLDESFEGDFSDWSQINNNADTVYWGFYQESGNIDLARTGTIGAGIYYSTSGNDDYLVTPQFFIPENKDIEFTVWAHSQDPTYLEDFNVKLSTTGSSVDDFSNNLGEVRGVPSEWTQYSYDLSQFGGQSVYLTVHCVSVDRFYLFLDDFLVTATGASDIDDFVEIIPTSFELCQNYPNPFNPSTRISYSIPELTKVKLTVFDINGKVIEELVNDNQKPGTYTLTWNAIDNSTGIYFIRLETSDFTKVRKMMFVK